MRTICRTLCLSLLGSAAACSTSGTVETPTPVAVTKLTDDFKLSARLGSPPIELQDEDRVARFALNPQGLPSEYLIVVMPDLVDGKISIPVAKSTGSVESAAEYNGYLDKILRAHRLFLRVDLNEARAVLAEVDKDHGQTYASLVLRASIAILQKKPEEAMRALATAKKMNPQAELLMPGGAKK